MKNKIDFSTQPYFPYHFVVLGVVFFLVSILISLMKTIVAAILFVFGIIFITTNYRLTIDVKDKWYKEHLWLLGFKIGKAKPYQKIEHIYFNKLRRETEYGFVARLTSRKVIYQGYLKVADDEPIFIGESTKEEPLLKKGEKLAKNLGVEIRKNY